MIGEGPRWRQAVTKDGVNTESRGGSDAMVSDDEASESRDIG